jgi:hypothetical protein
MQARLRAKLGIARVEYTLLPSELHRLGDTAVLDRVEWRVAVELGPGGS